MIATAGCEDRKSEFVGRSPLDRTALEAQGTESKEDSSPLDVTIDLPDGQLHFVRLGANHTGTPLILLNGGPGLDLRSMASSPAWKALAATRPVVLYDQRGTGKSSSSQPMDGLTVAKLVADLDALRNYLQAQKVDLLGWSWGGFLAMAYAVEHADRVRRLVLVGSAPPKLTDNIYLFESVFPDLTAKETQSVAAAEETGCESARIVDYMRMEFYDPQRRDQYLAAHRPFGFVEEMCVAAMQDALKLDLSQAVARLQIETLVTTGRFDTNVAPLVSYRLSKSMPRAQLQIFERSGHMPFIEQPEEFADAVESFLGATGAAQTGERTVGRSQG